MNKETTTGSKATIAKDALVIGKTGRQTLTPNQLAFNKLSEKIEKLHLEIKNKHRLYETALMLYAQKVHPSQIVVVTQKRLLLDVLWENYQSKKLGVSDQRNLKNILQEHMQQYLHLSNERPDEKVREIFRELHGETYEAFEKREQEMQKFAMQEMFDEMDLDIDLDEVDFSNKNELDEKLQAARDKIQEEKDKRAEYREKRKRNKKKTKKQSDQAALKEAAAALRQKNISTIYKQLAKLFHPDLEQDEGKKAEKQIMMQELIAAYEEKNLHALLTLELKWIHKENDHLETLTEEKLAVYLYILREQAEGLEREKNEIYQQPRYAVLYNEFGPAIIKQPMAAVEAVYTHLKEMIDGLSKDISDYGSGFGLPYIKEMIKQWKQNRRRESRYDADYLRDLFR
ncbi:MAG: hypothetical protein V4717_15120 [Bacteroidota bacterium]